MKPVSPRVAALAPSFTVALVLVTVGLTALLAYRAFDASRAQQRLAEGTLRDYAGFAAFQLGNATSARLATQQRMALDSVTRWIAARGATPPLGAARLAALVESRGALCRCLAGVAFHYQVTFADGAVESSASPLASPANLRRIRDTVVAQAMAAARQPSPPGTPAGPLGPPHAPYFLVAIPSHLDGRPYLLLHVLAVDAHDAPLVAYGFAVRADRIVGDAVRTVLGTQPVRAGRAAGDGVRSVLPTQSVLPSTLIRGQAIDSILTIRVTDASRRVVYQTDPAPDMRYAAVDSIEPRLGGLRFVVAINPAAAGRLIIGGLPRSRLPEVLASAFVAVGMLGLLLYQFRRQEELGRLRDSFVSGVSHELRTPLAQIRLLAELLRLGKVPTDDGRDRSLRIIDQEARRLAFLVDSILSYTRSDDARPSPVDTDVAAEIEEIVWGFEPLAQAHSAHLHVRLERDLVAAVDRGALRQVLLNLLDNAVRYGPPGQTVHVTTASNGDSWTLEVADEGPGIPPDEQERVFTPYYRMRRDADGAVGGTGIGLAVVRRLVAQHGGEVRVAAADHAGGAGARFVVTLPIAPSNPSHA